MRPLRALGFSLIELMVVVTIVVILVLVALPSASDWLQNAKTRSVAESVQNGLRFAQTEAARLNRFTTFVPTATAWTVDYTAVDSLEDTFPHPLQTSPAGSLEGTVITPSATTPAIIQFNSLGRAFGGATAAGPFTALASDATFDITNPNGSRKLRVIVTEAGKTRMCDPDKTFSPTTPDGC